MARHTMTTRGRTRHAETDKQTGSREAIKAGFEKFTEIWNSSSSNAELVRLIREEILTQAMIPLDKALSLGLGSFETESFECGPVRWDRCAQLVVFETALETLRKKFNIKQVYLQDPDFTKVDVRILEERGCEFPSLKVIICQTRPSLYLGSDPNWAHDLLLEFGNIYKSLANPSSSSSTAVRLHLEHRLIVYR
ncbi:hypothetical protein DL98DRAFT_534354 [Cadophora sp. DSE1049]|nr:hypothetical protein DL98DRAFT_534354 [Cadophora sp. DSE1049]